MRSGRRVRHSALAACPTCSFKDPTAVPTFDLQHPHFSSHSCDESTPPCRISTPMLYSEEPSSLLLVVSTQQAPLLHHMTNPCSESCPPEPGPVHLQALPSSRLGGSCWHSYSHHRLHTRMSRSTPMRRLPRPHVRRSRRCTARLFVLIQP